MKLEADFTARWENKVPTSVNIGCENIFCISSSIFSDCAHGTASVKVNSDEVSLVSNAELVLHHHRSSYGTTTTLRSFKHPASCSGLDLQDGGVVVKNGQNYFVHILPQTQVDLLLLFHSIHQLKNKQKKNILLRSS